MSTHIEDEESFSTLLTRADQGDSHACAKIGHIYAAGDDHLGVAQDRARAIQYYEKGADAGDLHCMHSLAAAELPEQPDKAIALLEACARQKYVWSLAVLGDFYLRGRHVARDEQKAFAYLQEYTTLCRPEKIGEHAFKVRWDLVLYPICLLRGIGCEKDEQKALSVLRELSALGNLSAADILQTGKLNDWMAAKRFAPDAKPAGALVLFAQDTRNLPVPAKRFAPPQPQVHKPQYEVLHKKHLTRFLKRTLIPDEPILMRGVFPRIYTVDSFLWLFFFLFLGRWAEHLMAVNGDHLYASLPYQIYAFLYQYPQLPVVLLGAFGLAIFLKRMVKKWTTEIVLTDRRFIYKHGLFSIEMVQMNFWQIEHSDVTQSMLGSFLDYGNVHIQSWAVQNREDPATARGFLILPAISHPFLFSRLIEDNRKLPYKGAQVGGSTHVPMWPRH